MKWVSPASHRARAGPESRMPVDDPRGVAGRPWTALAIRCETERDVATGDDSGGHLDGGVYSRRS